MAALEAPGEASLRRLRSEEPPAWLTPSTDLSGAAREASEYLFSSLAPYCSKCPLQKLFVDGFDAEQIWQQIDLQNLALLPSLRREIRRLSRNKHSVPDSTGEAAEFEAEKEEDERISDEEEEEEEMEDEDGEEEDEEEEEEGEREEGTEEEEEEGRGIEDRFLKVKDLERFLEEEERREFGGRAEKHGNEDVNDEEEEEEEDGDDLGGSDEDSAGAEVSEKSRKYPRYDDFFENKKKKKNQNKQMVELDNLDTDDEDDNNIKRDQLLDESNDSIMDDEHEGDPDAHKKESADLSTYERQQEKVQSKIKQMEKANLEPKTWTMQGEITAAKRPKNSALEVDLDFEHNVRPAPVITEEVTASLEDVIKQRIVQGRFDDVRRTTGLASKEPKEIKELDENKSQKGLAEIYEEEYMQKTGLAPSSLTFRDELKKEASLLFKQLCLKLDALSHFHFAPKPVIEDMSIQTNVPALAMEEIAPLAVSEAAMLAPEEVFAGKGDIKEEGELTQAERKRRRANKKRKFKAESAKRLAKKVLLNPRNENGVADS